MYVIVAVTMMKGTMSMKNMPLLKEGAELSLEALKANFRANDFSTAVSGYDCDRASSQDNRFYERLQKHFAKVWNAQMLQLSQKGSLYINANPIRSHRSPSDRSPGKAKSDSITVA